MLEAVLHIPALVAILVPVSECLLGEALLVNVAYLLQLVLGDLQTDSVDVDAHALEDVDFCHEPLILVVGSEHTQRFLVDLDVQLIEKELIL